MISNDSFAIKKYEFDEALPKVITTHNYARDLWPIVYIISDGDQKMAYVGETADAISRMQAHLKNNNKSRLTAIHLIESDKFNKSATLDIESNLIRYISGDGKYHLLNANLGLANHNYYQKKNVYWGMFQSIWDKLRSEGICVHSLEYIDNSDLFKYSPYKTLSTEQQRGLSMIIDHFIEGSFKSLIIEGGAGTGKTILAVFLFKLLVTDLSDFNYNELGKEDEVELIQKVKILRGKYPNPKMALVVPMTSFRNTLKKVFTNVKGLKASMVVGPTEITKEKHDIIIVDEAHRLRRRVNLTNYASFDEGNRRLGLDVHLGTELDWVQLQSTHAFYFYDASQSIKPSDVKEQDFKNLAAEKTTKFGKLTSQFRVRGGNGYVKFIHDLMDANTGDIEPYYDSIYEFKSFDSILKLLSHIKAKDQEVGLSRLIAGFSWKWISKKDPELYDIEIEGTELRWNTVPSDWINSEESINEVGCIHTTQGYDLNYAGIIFGNEIGYDPVMKKIIIRKENYFDRNGKNGIKDPDELKDFILNIYKTILLRGIKGTYIYACDPDLRDFIASNVGGPEMTSSDENSKPTPIPWVNSVPLFDLKAAAGSFSEQQMIEEDSAEWILVPHAIKPSKDLFACKVVGESMNRVIPNGAICLFKKYQGGSRNGKIVLVESTDIQDSDTGSSYTVKEYYSRKSVNDAGWEHQSITLKPNSTDPSYENIILAEDDLESFKVVGLFERVLD